MTESASVNTPGGQTVLSSRSASSSYASSRYGPQAYHLSYLQEPASPYLLAPPHCPIIGRRYTLLNHITQLLLGSFVEPSPAMMWQASTYEHAFPIFHTTDGAYEIITTTFRPVWKSLPGITINEEIKPATRFMMVVDVVQNGCIMVSLGSYVTPVFGDGLPDWQDIKATARFLRRMGGYEREFADCQIPLPSDWEY